MKIVSINNIASVPLAPPAVSPPGAPAPGAEIYRAPGPTFSVIHLTRMRTAKDKGLEFMSAMLVYVVLPLISANLNPAGVTSFIIDVDDALPISYVFRNWYKLSQP